jgi:hypothetical protein
VRTHAQAAYAAGGDAKPTLAHIVRRHGASSATTERLSAAQRRALRAIARCRTAELGGHIAQLSPSDQYSPESSFEFSPV